MIYPLSNPLTREDLLLITLFIAIEINRNNQTSVISLFPWFHRSDWHMCSLVTLLILITLLLAYFCTYLIYLHTSLPLAFLVGYSVSAKSWTETKPTRSDSETVSSLVEDLNLCAFLQTRYFVIILFSRSVWHTNKMYSYSQFDHIHWFTTQPWLN